MKRFAAGLLAASLIITTALPVFAQAPAGAVPAKDTPESPEITVYNQNFGLVKDYRTITLTKGNNTVFVDNVASLIDPTSVHFKSLTSPDGVWVKEQNFRYDLINKSNILDRMVGKKIRFRKNGVEMEGVLLNPVTTTMRYPDNGQYNYGAGFQTQTNSEFAVQTDHGILLTDLGEVIIEELPEGLYPRPTLMWQLGSDVSGAQKSEVAYLTDGLNWRANYVAVVNGDDSKMDLTGWVTLDNQSGASYKNAKLKLVAGDVRKVQPGQNRYALAGAMKSMARDDMSESRQNFQEESFFEYHLYTLQHPTDVINRETKQVTLVTATDIPVEKRYTYDAARVEYNGWLLNGYGNYGYGGFDYYLNRPGAGSDTSTYKKVNTTLVIKNSEANHLGMPLPKGTVRVNKADASGSVQFVGEDVIDHTPRDEKIELYVGDAFDLVGEHKRMNYKRENDWIEETYEIKLRNHKKSAATINVVEHLFGDWKVVSKSHEFKKDDAHTINFAVPVPANGQTVVTYTVHINRN